MLNLSFAGCQESEHPVLQGVPTQFIPHNKPDVILARFGLDAAGITAAVTRLVQ